jgi:ABC-type sugar transport system permease subunit
MNTTPYGKLSRITGWIYVLPALVFFIVFMLFPIIYNIINSVSLSSSESFFANYITLFHDSTFIIALQNSMLWVFFTTLMQMVIGFVLAILLERRIARGRVVFRTILFLPMAITPTVIALVFNNLYAPQYGLLFGLFQQFGLAASFPSLLSDPHYATYALMAISIWQWLGFYVLMYSVGVANIDGELLDAADLDGASGWSRIRYIYFPLLRSSHLSLFILGALQALQQFPLIYLMTEGGPANSTQVLATYIFQKGFMENQMQYASAISVVLLLLALVIAGIQIIGTRGDFSIGGGE